MKKAGILIAFALFCLGGWLTYNALFKNNVAVERYALFIHQNTDFQTILDTLKSNNVLKSTSSFSLLSKQKNYPSNIKPGYYILTKGMSNNQIVNLLKAGNQSPVKVVINSAERISTLCGYLSKHLMHDSTQFAQTLLNNDSLSAFGYNKENALCMILPNTYEFYWTIPPKKFLQKMQQVYKSFWNEERKAKLKTQKLSRLDACVLASIARKETVMKDEAEKVAGVYINRLRIGMALQADPTLLFILNDKSLKRVLNEHKTLESPYNTYKYPGLPPGPIDMPQPYVIDAILNYKKHNYLYFCAKEDFSGYHNFARTYDAHMVNARKYQKELNKKQIFR